MQKILMLCYLLYFLFNLVFEDRGLVVEFFDVGFGDSILVTTPNGGKVLVDGGGNNEIVGYLAQDMPPGFCSLDVVILTHPHADHLFGLSRVLDYCHVNKVISAYLEYDSTLYSDWKKTLELSEIEVDSLHKGELFYLDGIEFLFLWPIEGYFSDNMNNNSFIFLVDSGDFEVLLTGDAELEVLSQITKEDFLGRVDGSLDVVKVPHHGSATSMYPKFYSWMDPVHCIISVGSNKYGLPSDDFIDYLDSIGCAVRRTDFEGTIRVVYNSSR